MNYQAIGNRIKEQRKMFKKISQEKLAEDLGMYQADISNIEKGKKGSGIDDLNKLELIANYFGISLHYLLSGIEGKENMEKYLGEKMVIKAEDGLKISDEQWKTLQKLTGAKSKKTIEKSYHCGDYTTHIMIETQGVVTNETTFENGTVQSPAVLVKAHLYTFYGNDVVSTMTAVITDVYQSICLPYYNQFFKYFRHCLELDLFDNVRLLNPYVPLNSFEEDEKKQEEYGKKMLERMQKLRDLNDETPVLLIDSAYVKEDCREHGILRLNLDVLKNHFGDCIMWLNMKPYSGIDLSYSYEMQPTFDYPRIGQFSKNNYIAERLGFTINPDLWYVEVLAEDTKLSDEEVRVKIDFADAEEELNEALGISEDVERIKTKIALVNKVAYYLPQRYLDIIKDDGDLVEEGRALQKIYYKKHHQQNN